MAIKATIQNLINSLIRSNPSLIDKTEHADVEDALLLNSYGNVTNETQLVNTITTENASNPLLQYNVFFFEEGIKFDHNEGGPQFVLHQSMIRMLTQIETKSY